MEVVKQFECRARGAAAAVRFSTIVRSDGIAKSAEALKKHRINLAIDTNHPKPDGEMTNREVESMLREYGYEVHSEASPLLATWARPR